MSEILLDINKLILTNRLKDIHKKNGVVYVADFDSGYLTDFIVEIKIKHKLNIIMDSFAPFYSDQVPLYQNHKIIKTDFVTCSDASYNNMISRRQYNPIKMVKSQQSPKRKMYNVFFKLRDKDLRPHYDLVMITGPNSNGRDIAFLHIKERMMIGGFILLNELDKFVSLETMDTIFKTKTEFKNNVSIDRIALFRITDFK